MIAYLSVYAVCILLSIAGQKYSNLRAITLVAITIIISVLVGFRPAESGIDTQNYYLLYEQVLHNFEGSWMVAKFGYVFYYLSQLANFMGGGAAYLTFFYALLTCSFIFYTTYRHSVSLPISVAYFFTGIGLFFFMHNVMRQALAIAIIFYSISFITNKNLLKFVATTTLAVLVHASAVFFIPFYFLARLPIKSFILVVAWLLSLPFIFIPSLIVSIIKSLSFIVPNQYVHYLTAQEMYEKGGISGIGLVLMLKQGMFFLVWLAYREDLQLTHSRVIYLLAMYAVILGNIVLGLGLIGRFNEYLFIFMLLALPMAIKSLIKQSQQHFVLFSAWLMLTVIFIQNLFAGSQGVNL